MHRPYELRLRLSAEEMNILSDLVNEGLGTILNDIHYASVDYNLTDDERAAAEEEATTYEQFADRLYGRLFKIGRKVRRT
jgi:hypothetical protein